MSDTRRRAKGQPGISFKERKKPDYVVYGDPTRSGRMRAIETADEIAEEDPGAVVEVRIGTRDKWNILFQTSFAGVLKAKR